MHSRKALVMAALAGIALGVAQPSQLQAQENKEVKCYGVNSCKGHSSCSVSAEDVAAFKTLLGKDYDAKFGKTTTHSCGSHASCGAANGVLNWTKISADSCQQQNGYVIEKQDGKEVAKKA